MDEYEIMNFKKKFKRFFYVIFIIIYVCLIIPFVCLGLYILGFYWLFNNESFEDTMDRLHFLFKPIKIMIEAGWK